MSMGYFNYVITLALSLTNLQYTVFGYLLAVFNQLPVCHSQNLCYFSSWQNHLRPWNSSCVNYVDYWLGSMYLSYTISQRVVITVDLKGNYKSPGVITRNCVITCNWKYLGRVNVLCDVPTAIISFIKGIRLSSLPLRPRVHMMSKIAASVAKRTQDGIDVSSWNKNDYSQLISCSRVILFLGWATL